MSDEQHAVINPNMLQTIYTGWDISALVIFSFSWRKPTQIKEIKAETWHFNVTVITLFQTECIETQKCVTVQIPAAWTVYLWLIVLHANVVPVK